MNVLGPALGGISDEERSLVLVDKSKYWTKKADYFLLSKGT